MSSRRHRKLTHSISLVVTIPPYSPPLWNNVRGGPQQKLPQKKSISSGLNIGMTIFCVTWVQKIKRTPILYPHVTSLQSASGSPHLFNAALIPLQIKWPRSICQRPFSNSVTHRHLWWNNLTMRRNYAVFPPWVWCKCIWIVARRRSKFWNSKEKLQGIFLSPRLNRNSQRSIRLFILRSWSKE